MAADPEANGTVRLASAGLAAAGGLAMPPVLASVAGLVVAVDDWPPGGGLPRRMPRVVMPPVGDSLSMICAALCASAEFPIVRGTTPRQRATAAVNVRVARILIVSFPGSTSL